MNIEETIQKAIEGGWRPCDLINDWDQIELERNEPHSGTWICNPEGDGCFIEDAKHAFLDPIFWQSFVKCLAKDHRGIPVIGGWQRMWHEFIDHLIEEKDIESFFNQF